MQATSKRVRTIYSVIASANRLDILRILNSKGPLSYSELKTLAGFKSKKESGKFAYHLRKLVRQLLVTLNRAERRYTVTNLGRLILNLTRGKKKKTSRKPSLYLRKTRPGLFFGQSIHLIKIQTRLAEFTLKVTENKHLRFQ